MSTPFRNQIALPMIACFVLAVIFVLFPQIDLYVSGLFYNSDQGFVYKYNDAVASMYALFKHMPKFLLPVMMLTIIVLYIPKISIGRKDPEAVQAARKLRKPWLFLLLVLLIGPGIIVHLVFKESFDRPRPRAVQEFNGAKEFSPAFVVADQPGRNKSFVSGHSAMGFYFIVLAWVFQRRRWILVGLAIGATVSLGRIVQGGHFLSDTIFAGFVCYFTAQLVAYWIYKSPFIRRD